MRLANANQRENHPVPGGAPLFQRVFTRLGCDGRPPRFRVEFYAYSSLVLTIRRREEMIYVRFSDLLRRAPLPLADRKSTRLNSSHVRISYALVCLENNTSESTRD